MDGARSMDASRRTLTLSLAAVFSLGSAAVTAGSLTVNGDFETGDRSGWSEWSSPWGQRPVVNYAWSDAPAQGLYALSLRNSSGSFGVYQELCVEPGVPLHLDWSWRGASRGNGWWEVLIVDAPYSYEAVDDPANHPETFFAAKWETGFGGPFPEPSAAWVDGNAEFTPTSAVVTLVLKCGSVSGGLIEAWFDGVVLTQETAALEIQGIEPAVGRTSGGDAIRLLGRVFPEGVSVALGQAAVDPVIRRSTCEVSGTTPQGEAGFVDVVVTTGGSTATLPAGFRYVPPPVVESITPASGGVAGGTAIVIAGGPFAGSRPGDVTVRIGGSPLASLAVEGEATITGSTPPGEPGPADVRVTTPFGEVTVTAGFHYETVAVARFIRGDCTGEGGINITDGVALLNFLFMGGAAPPCREACNMDDGNDLNISDGIAVLNFLFLGGPGPAPPYPACGPDVSASGGAPCEFSHPACP